MQTIIENIFSEFQHQPATLILLMIGCGTLWYFEETHADSAELQQVVTKYETVEAKVNLLVEINVAFSLREARAAWCREDDPTARQILERSIDRYLIEYRQVTGTGYNLSSCSNESGSTY